MNDVLPISLQWHDWLGLFLQYLMLSLLSVGGAISTTSDMHRYLVDQNHWLTQTQFNSSIALAQAAPGPNVLFVALIGWNLGINSGSLWAGLFGVCVTMVGIMLPSTTITYMATQWGHRNREMRQVRAFKQGMAPLVIALLISTGWILASANTTASDWPLWLLAIVSAMIVWHTRLHMLLLLAAGAALGWFGLV